MSKWLPFLSVGVIVLLVVSMVTNIMVDNGFGAALNGICLGLNIRWFLEKKLLMKSAEIIRDQQQMLMEQSRGRN